MTPDQFLRSLKGQPPAPAYLFLGPVFYMRDQCRRALVEAALPVEDREQGLEQHDLDEEELPSVMDGACTFSLFASRRLIWISAAEGAVPKGKAIAAASDDEDAAGPKEGPALVAQYLRDPTPGTVVVFDSSRFEFEGDDKARIDRVRKFYAAVPNVVEFRCLDSEAALALAQKLARNLKLQIGNAELTLLVDALGSDASRIAIELEKLSIFAGTDRQVSASDIASLVPNAQQNTIFELVAALGAGNRSQSLTVLDALVREGEYLPLALNFLASQLRLALVAREAGARTSADILMHFNRMGIKVWRDRAEQVRQTLQAFPKEKIEKALVKISAADRGLRDTRPDDRIVMEELILSLTS
jgi:DNA polymerase-3 subunit delta